MLLFLYIFYFIYFGLTAKASRILVPQPGIEPMPPVVKEQILNH